MTAPARTATALLTTDEAAALLRVSDKEIRALVRGGKLKYVLFGKRRRLFDPADLTACIEAHKIQGPECPSTERKGRRTGTTTSSSKVYDITAVLAQKSAKPRKR